MSMESCEPRLFHDAGLVSFQSIFVVIRSIEAAQPISSGRIPAPQGGSPPADVPGTMIQKTSQTHASAHACPKVRFSFVRISIGSQPPPPERGPGFDPIESDPIEILFRANRAIS